MRQILIINNNTVKKTLSIVLAILAISTIITGILLSIQLVNYIKVDEHDFGVKSNIEKDLNLFDIQYMNETGEVTVVGASNQKVLAPCVSEEFTIRFRNTDKVAIDYELTTKVEYSSEYKIPLMVRLLDQEGNYLIGDAKNWVKLEDINDFNMNETLVKRESAEYYFQWKWDFEGGDDKFDTLLGGLTEKVNVGVSVKFHILSVANTSIGANGGVVKSGLGEIIFSAISFVLLLGSCGLIIYVISKKNKSEKIWK